MRLTAAIALTVSLLAGGAQAKTVVVTAQRLLDVSTGKYI